MNKNKIILLVAVVLIIVGVYFFISGAKPDDGVPTAEVTDTASDTQDRTAADGDDADAKYTNATVTWKGFGPGKVHNGGFETVVSDIARDDGVLSGIMTVDMNSMYSDTEKLTTHLKSADFFDVSVHGEAKFIIESNTTDIMTGNMTIHGVTKSVSFPYTATPDGYTTTFNINMQDFGIDQAFANETIELTINLK